MSDRTVRPSNRALRAAGLLPKHEPLHHVDRGNEVPPQPELVWQVFGSPEAEGEKTIIPLASVRYLRGTVRYRQVAKIEVSATGVTVETKRKRVALLLWRALVLAWNVYWLARIVRERSPRKM